MVITTIPQELLQKFDFLDDDSFVTKEVNMTEEDVSLLKAEDLYELCPRWQLSKEDAIGIAVIPTDNDDGIIIRHFNWAFDSEEPSGFIEAISGTELKINYI